MYERFRKEKSDLALKFVEFTKKQERSQIKQRNHKEAKIQGLRNALGTGTRWEWWILLFRKHTIVTFKMAQIWNRTTTSFLDFSRLEHAQAIHEHTLTANDSIRKRLLRRRYYRQLTLVFIIRGFNKHRQPTKRFAYFAHKSWLPFSTGNRGGSRVVQVISRNHSNVSKPAFVTPQVLYCSSRNQLSFLFYCLLWNKKKKKASHLVISSITQHTRSFPSEFDECPFARFRPLSILPN